MGKTRLAVAVASDQAHQYLAGVWYTDLVPVTDPAMIAPAVASVLGLGTPVGLSEHDAVIQALAQREGLLILDNCEHLVDGIAVFVEKLLASGDRMHVLATSRTRLLVPFEHVYQVPGLSLSEEAGDAVALFQARAAAVGSPVTDQDDLRRAAAVCRALDGLALAIELAAVRLPTLGIGGLEAGLGDRLRLLAGGSRVDDRHSSLRTALDWSYELADPADRAVLRRVAVFAAPFTVDAAAAVAGLAPVPVGEELHDAHSMAVETYIGVGDLPAAHQLAEPLLRHPESYDTPAGWHVRGNGQLGALRSVVADALAGDWDLVLEAASRFRQDWERQGRPRIPVHAKGAAAVAMVHGLRGDSEAREDWSEIYRTLRYTKPRNRDVWASVVEAVDLLHHSEPTKVARQMAADPTEQQPWYNGLWRQWYAALQAEAAVLAGHPQAGLRLERARRVAAGNPIATALVTRTDAWVRNDRDRLIAAAEDLDTAGCPYQVARTLVLAGGDEAAEGARLMADLGAAPMAAPVAHP